MTRILITGALGQLGTELTTYLRRQLSPAQVLATDIRPGSTDEGPFALLDITDGARLSELVRRYQITQIYHLAAILSAKGEEHPLRTWQINMDSWLNVLEVARTHSIKKVYFPSSIAVFGKNTPAAHTPQFAYLSPRTVYGISKQAGEQWAQYYYERYGLDVRSLRYPGLISHKNPPGGGTTDYAVEIFYAALRRQPYTCFLKPDTCLPMMYMPDAVRGTVELMEAPAARISTHTGYNMGAMSFSPEVLFACIRKALPDFSITYQPDFRQKIAESWPDSLDDQLARQDWGWKEVFGIEAMTQDMLTHLRQKIPETVS